VSRATINNGCNGSWNIYSLYRSLPTVDPKDIDKKSIGRHAHTPMIKLATWRRPARNYDQVEIRARYIILIKRRSGRVPSREAAIEIRSIPPRIPSCQRNYNSAHRGSAKTPTRTFTCRFRVRARTMSEFASAEIVGDSRSAFVETCHQE